jgi:membrane-bound lytic murein transglycosylase D
LINKIFIFCIIVLCNQSHAESQLELSIKLTGHDHNYSTEQYQANITPVTPTDEDVAILLSNTNPDTEVTANQEDGALWQRLRNTFTLQDMDSPLVTRHEQWYAHRPDYVARMMTRANRYLYYITREVERRGMPAEIALLPMIESAYNPEANSSANASGIWQFIPSTGLRFGLQQNWWYDGRRDIVSATAGALDYLQKLHTKFGDWELALAAYNWGEGSVQRAQEYNRKRGLGVDYASLKMPDETRNYLPKLFAIKNIVANPTRYGLTLPNIINQPYFAMTSSEKHIDAELIAQLADISKEEFSALNPGHTRPVILQNHGDAILLPVDKIEIFRSNLDSYDKPLVSWQSYRASKGERLDDLAPRVGLSLEKLRSVNGLSTQTHLGAGETLLIPMNSETIDSTDNEINLFSMQPPPVQAIIKPTIQLKNNIRKRENYAKLTRREHSSAHKS